MPNQWELIAESLRHRARGLVTLRGLAWTALITVGVLWLAGLTDWLLHLDASWLRLLLATGIVTVVGITVWQTLWRPLRVRLSDVDIARTIEQRFPQWGDQLSSTAQFRHERFADRLGSAALQQAVTADVDQRLEQIDTKLVVSARPTRRLALTAAIVCLLGITGALWQRSAAATALTRLAMPFADIEWPRTTHLQFLGEDLQPLKQSSLRTAAGDPLVLYLENSLGPLPDDLSLELRLPDGRNEQRVLQTTMMRDDSRQTHEVGIVSLTAHEGPILLRASGGDERAMPWTRLEVVPPPALTDVTLTITPPAYTATAPVTVKGAGQIEALVGSRIQITGQANTPLSAATLRREGYPPQVMTPSENGRQFEVTFDIEQAGHDWYWFDIADAHGLRPGHPPRYELRGVADRKPTVFIDQPGADVTLTPDAELPLRIIARDDLGLQTVQLVHTRPEKEPALITLPLAERLPTSETIETIWSLAPLGLSSGDRVTYHVEAVDAFDLVIPAEESQSSVPVGDLTTSLEVRRPAGTGQVGLSAYRHIDILSSEEKRREIAARQTGILDALKKLQEQQARALESTAGLRIQSEVAESLQSDDLDLLKQTELEQQDIRSQLTAPRTGARSEVERLRLELESNRIDDPQMAQRLDDLHDELSMLTDDLLPVIEQSLARARKLAQPGTAHASSTGTQQQLRLAEQTQTQSLARLSEATSQLGGWQRRFELSGDLDTMIADQTEIQQQTQQIGRETLMKRPDTLSVQQQADLARLSDRQRRLASRLEDLLKQGNAPGPEEETARPTDDATRQALQRLGERRTVGHMHNAAESLRRNDIATSTEAQQQVLSDLRQFGELMHSGDQGAVESLLASLDEQAEEVETLRKRQAELARQAQQSLGPSADPERTQQLERLQKRQQELAEQVDELARQLRRQQQRASAQSAARAARRMREAQQSMARQQAEQTADSQQDALDDLAQLADELAEKKRQLEHELAQQQVEQLGDDLQDLSDRQEVLIEQTVDLNERQEQRGSWSRSLRKELRELADAQSALADRLDELRTAVSDHPVIDLALEQAADPMRAVVARMNQTDAGAQAQQQQRTAHQRLLGLIEATQQLSQSPEQGHTPETPASTSSQQSQASQLLITQLRLLRHLQADVTSRTTVLTQQLQDEDVSSTAAAEIRETLARDQQRVAEVAQALMQQLSGFATDAAEREQQ